MTWTVHGTPLSRAAPVILSNAALFVYILVYMSDIIIVLMFYYIIIIATIILYYCMYIKYSTCIMQTCSTLQE